MDFKSLHGEMRGCNECEFDRIFMGFIGIDERIKMVFKSNKNTRVK